MTVAWWLKREWKKEEPRAELAGGLGWEFQKVKVKITPERKE